MPSRVDIEIFGALFAHAYTRLILSWKNDHKGAEMSEVKKFNPAAEFTANAHIKSM